MCYAYKLFEGIKVERITNRPYPETFNDYKVTDAWAGQKCGDVVVPGVKLYRRVDPR